MHVSPAFVSRTERPSPAATASDPTGGRVLWHATNQRRQNSMSSK